MSKIKFFNAKGRTAHSAFQSSLAHQEPYKGKQKTQDDTAWIRTEQAERRFQDGLLDKGLACLQSALAHADKSPRPVTIYSIVIKSYFKYRYLPEAEKAISLAREKFPDNIAIITQQGKLYLLQEKPEATIQLLKPYYTQNKEDIFLASTLANAYLHAGNPAETIKILKPFYHKSRSDLPVLKILANAYIYRHQTPEFSEVVARIEDTRTRDYLTAKFHYLSNETQKAMSILRPYATGDKSSSRNIRYLFFACTGGLAITEGEQEECEKWRNNPYRDTLSSDFMASSVRLYEEGANPVSKGSKQAASLGRDARVHVRERGPK